MQSGQGKNERGKAGIYYWNPTVSQKSLVLSLWGEKVDEKPVLSVWQKLPRSSSRKPRIQRSLVYRCSRVKIGPKETVGGQNVKASDRFIVRAWCIAAAMISLLIHHEADFNSQNYIRAAKIMAIFAVPIVYLPGRDLTDNAMFGIIFTMPVNEVSVGARDFQR